MMLAIRTASLLPYQGRGWFSGMLLAELLEGGIIGFLTPWSRFPVRRKFWSACHCRSERFKYFFQTVGCDAGRVATRLPVKGWAGVLVPIMAAERSGVKPRDNANTTLRKQRL